MANNTYDEKEHLGERAGGRLAEWDGKKWVKVSDWIVPMKKKVQPLLDKAANDYVAKATGWPKRTEKCDKAS